MTEDGAVGAGGGAGDTGSHRAVCFDMDGVLLDSESYWMEMEETEILPWAVPDADVSADEVTGMPYREIYDHLAANYDVAVTKDEWVDRFDEAAAEIFGERADLLPAFPDLRAALAERGVPVALVTSSPRHWIEVAFERFGLDGAFDVVVSADDLDAAGKPEPHVYEHAADLLEVDPADVVAIEDSGNGIRAAHAAGTTVIAFRFGGDPGDGPADHLAGSPGELHDLVLDLVDDG